MRIGRRQWGGVGGAAVAALAVLGGCRDKGYSQATPDDVLRTARAMVENGDAERLTDLVYTESREFRGFLNGMGESLGLLARLGQVVQERFPNEVAALRAEAEQAAKDGRASSFVARAMTLAGQSRRARRGQETEDPRATFNKMAMELMSDPYAWLTRNADRLTTTTEGMPDDSAAVLWDGKPVFPPIGLAMTRKDGRWSIMLPGPVTAVLPKSADEWEIAGALVGCVDNAIKDSIEQIEQGRAQKLEDVARILGENALIPIGIAIVAYDRAVDARREAARAAAGRAPGGG
jgi:hypothetical protein